MDVKLIHVCNRDITAMFHNSRFNVFIASLSVILTLILYLLMKLINKATYFSKLVIINRRLFSFHGNTCANLFEFNQKYLQNFY